MKPSVRQLIVGAARSDAITNMALSIARSISHVADAEIFSFHPVGPDLRSEIKDFAMIPEGEHNDVFVYHSSFGIPQITRLLRERHDKLVLVYHNITPADRYWDLAPDFASALEWGRHELVLLRERVVAAVADSEFNASELLNIGYRDVIVIPAGIDPFRLTNTQIDPKFNRELGENFPEGFILFVSQVLPHKRVELALEVVHLLRSVHRLDLGLVVAGPMRNPRYSEILSKYRSKLPEAKVLFLGEATEAQLATLYRKATVYLGTSDHEGLGLPPLEAMSAGCPVVVRGSGAIPETVGMGALVINPAAGVLELTEAIAEVIHNGDLRNHLVGEGFRRVKQIATPVTGRTILDVIEAVLR